MAGNVLITGNQIQDSAIPEPKLDQEVRDRLGGGIDWKRSCRFATTGNIVNLNGGAPASLDGFPVNSNDRILVWKQGTAAQNGIYFVLVVGTGANGVWLRDSDADSDAEVTAGLTTYVAEGSSGTKIFSLTTTDPVDLGVTPLTFEITGGVGVGGSSTQVFAAPFLYMGSLAVGDAVVVSAAADNTVVRADNATLATADVIGLVYLKDSPGAGQCVVQLSGEFSGLTLTGTAPFRGKRLYLGTNGALRDTAPLVGVVKGLGVARSNSVILLAPEALTDLS